MKKFMLNQ